jgi:hypothetical protein
VLREYVAMGGRIFLSGAFAPLAFIFNNVDLSGCAHKRHSPSFTPKSHCC